MGRRALLCAILATGFIGAAAPPASAAVFFAAECQMTLSLTFTPALTAIPQSGTVSFSSTSSSCVGTSMFGAATITGGSSSGSISCGLIATTSGSATLNYSPNPSGQFTPVFAGNVAALALVMLPKTATILGTGAFTLPGMDGDCSGGVDGVTLTGAIVFSDPSLE
jgi:hypothetical protein